MSAAGEKNLGRFSRIHTRSEPKSPKKISFGLYGNFGNFYGKKNKFASKKFTLPKMG